MKDGRINNALQNAYIRRYTLTDGKEAGLRVIEMVGGDIRVLLNESKALDIMQIWYEGQNMSFVSKNGFTAREIDFLERFEGGMLYTCGLDSVGGREGFVLHGTHHNTPAKVISLIEGDDKLEVTALIEESALFGKNLMMKRVITLFTNENRVRVDDTLVNKGTKTEDYCLLYHTNFGYPMLDEGVEIEANYTNICARSEYAKKHLANQPLFDAPIVNDEERCYFLDMAEGKAAVINKKLGKKATVTYSIDTLPSFVQWSSPVAGDYALGIEPCTTTLDDNFTYRQIKPDENVKFYLDLLFEKI